MQLIAFCVRYPALAREHVLHSFDLLAHVLEQFGNGERRLRVERG